MQKYYHKGAFFQTEGDDKFASVGTFDILHKRDFGEACGEDKEDRKVLAQAAGQWAPPPAAVFPSGFETDSGEGLWAWAQALPLLMQLRKGQFGRAGRTKWTHLSAEDTTADDDQMRWGGSSDALRTKYISKMAGTNQPLEKPKFKG